MLVACSRISDVRMSSKFRRHARIQARDMGEGDRREQFPPVLFFSRFLNFADPTISGTGACCADVC